MIISGKHIEQEKSYIQVSTHFANSETHYSWINILIF